MSTRYLIAALLMTSACVAQADVLPTTGNDSASSLVAALYGKTSADQAGSTVSLNLTQGVDGPYVIGTSNTIMAAMLGFGMSVFKTQAVVTEPVVITPVATTPVATAPVVSNNAAPVASAPAEAVVAVEPVLSADPVADAGSNVEVGLDLGAGTDTGSNQDVATPVADAAGDVGAAADVAEVPEPSSIALMMAGMMGALSLRRRRR